ncbi:MAG: thioredoxin [Ruminococcus sp.]|nr:thioredoxin [Ruminococcus sp.]
MAVRVNTESFDAEVLQADKTVIVDFYSDSCVPCKRIAPLLSQIEQEKEGIKVARLNVNFDSELASNYDVTSVPTLVFFKDGKERSRLVGAVKKETIEETIIKEKLV